MENFIQNLPDSEYMKSYLAQSTSKTIQVFEILVKSHVLDKIDKSLLGKKVVIEGKRKKGKLVKVEYRCDRR